MRKLIRAALPGLTLSLAIAALSGCGSDDVCCAPPPEKPAKLIVYSVSGGYPPFGQQLRIEPKGTANLELTAIQRPGRSFRFGVMPNDLMAIRDSLDAVDLEALPQAELTCADCPLYEIRYGREAYEADSLTIPPELEPVFRRLDRLIDEGPEQRTSSPERGSATTDRQ